MVGSFTKQNYMENKSVYLTRQQKMVIVGILKLRLEEVKKWDMGIVEMYMFDTTINDIIKKLETPND
jgi:hypothetical protein